MGTSGSKRLHGVLLLASGVLLSFVPWGWAGDEVVFLVPHGARTNVAKAVTGPVSLPFFVHNNAVKPPPRNFAPSGYMGDVNCLRVMGAYTNVLQEGVPCIKVSYVEGGVGAWAGLVWQNPADNWGTKPRGGYNLTKATKVAFSARGERGGEVVEFKIGGAGGEYPDSATVSTGPISLTPKWVRYVIDLQGADLTYISTGFGFVVTEADNPKGCAFYLDDIGYVP